MEKIHQLKAEKKKEKGSQHDPEPMADMEETPVGCGPQNVEQHFVTMVDVATLLK